MGETGWRWLQQRLARLGGLLGSLRAAAVMMLLVAALAALGSVLPQLPPAALGDEAAVEARHEALQARYGRLTEPLLALGVFRFARSPLFLAPSAVLILATLRCALRRSSRAIPDGDAWAAALDVRLSAAPLAAVVECADQQAALVLVRRELRRKGFTLREWAASDTVTLRADRCRWTRSLSLVTHLATLLLVAGAALTSVAAWREKAAIPLGDTVAVGRGGRLAVRNEGLRIGWGLDDTPVEFEAQLAVSELGGSARAHSLYVNQPLQVGGYSLGLSSYWGEPGQYGVTLMVGRDPGYPLFVVGGGLLTVAMALTLAFPHASIGLRLRSGGVIHLAGWPKRYDWSLRREFRRLLTMLRSLEAGNGDRGREAESRC